MTRFLRGRRQTNEEQIVEDWAHWSVSFAGRVSTEAFSVPIDLCSDCEKKRERIRSLRRRKSWGIWSLPRWLGSKKFAIPSLITYSWPQLPQISFPSITWVSSSSRCKSLSVRSSSSASPSGFDSGRLGNPNCISSVSLDSPKVFINRDTSFAVARRPSQSIRGITLRINSGWKSSSCDSSSASWNWRGYDAGDVLQSLTAQVTKLAVMTFMFSLQSAA